MRLFVCGRDHSVELGAHVTAEAGRLPSAARAYGESDSALRLRDCRDPGEFLDTYLRLLRLRTAVRTDAFRVPRRPGVLGRLLGAGRLIAWRLLRYQHDRMFFQQNTVNTLLVEAVRELAEENRRLAAELGELRRGAGEGKP